MIIEIFLIELITVFNLSLLYLTYQIINRHFKDKSIINEQKYSSVHKLKDEGPKIPEIKFDAKTVKVETSFSNSRIGEIK